MAVLKLNNDEYRSFPSVLQDYANYTFAIKGNSEKTVCEYLLDLRTFFRYMLMQENGSEYDEESFEKISIFKIDIEYIKKISSSNIISYLVFMAQQKKATSGTRMRKLSALRSFFNYAYAKKHLIESNPCSDIDAPKRNKTLPKHLSLEECVNLLETVKNDQNSKTTVRDYAIISLFLNTGMRLSELVGLNLTSFNSELTQVKVLGKGKKERIIYLNDAAHTALVDYLKIRLDPRFISTSDKAFFLSRRQMRISNKTVQWIVYRYLEMSGLGDKGLSVHKLRHTAATLMYQSGKVDIRVLKDVLGHEQLNTTQIYTHVVNRNLEDAVQHNPLADIRIRRTFNTIEDKE